MRCFREGLILFIVAFIGVAALLRSASGQANCTGSQMFTAKDCAGDANSPEEKILFELVNKYRAANERPELRLSAFLSIVANRRMLDLRQNLKKLTHSWSNCAFELKNEKTWPCVLNAPQRLNSGYSGKGYETLYRKSAGNATSALALEAWRKSTLHNSIILNHGMFKEMVWDELGIAIDGEYAALWFGYRGGGARVAAEKVTGLGVTYDQAVAGLSGIFSIDKSSSTILSNKWRGISADKKIRLELFGTSKDISEANLSVAVELESDKKLSPKSNPPF